MSDRAPCVPEALELRERCLVEARLYHEAARRQLNRARYVVPVQLLAVAAVTVTALFLCPRAVAHAIDVLELKVADEGIADKAVVGVLMLLVLVVVASSFACRALLGRYAFLHRHASAMLSRAGAYRFASAADDPLSAFVVVVPLLALEDIDIKIPTSSLADAAALVKSVR